jgi:hypothetical protein
MEYQVQARAAEGLHVGGPAVNRQERRTFAVLVIARKMPNIFRGQLPSLSAPIYFFRMSEGVIANAEQ